MTHEQPPGARELLKFWLKVREHIFDGIEGPDCQEWAHEAGLLNREKYSHAIHGDCDPGFEEGDTIYVDVFKFEKPPATGSGDV